jgi:spore germination cell wall hydrolase CwlJ-like protein
MKLAWILWLSHVLPQPAADSLCLSTTVYLEARDQSARGQQAVAEVALRRRDSGLWGDNLCSVVTAKKQFAPTIVPADTRLRGGEAWSNAVMVALEAERNWALPYGQRQEVVPGASHFAAHAIATPAWSNAFQVARIGDHTFYRVQTLKPRHG